MEDNNWSKPDSFNLTLRCTKQKYAKNFMEQGEIKLSTPQSWVDYAINNTEGRGDKYEGMLAHHGMFDIQNMILLNAKYEKYRDLLRINYGNQVYLKKENDMRLPCFCVYTLRHSMFQPPSKPGRQRISTTIPGSYFRDFSDDMDEEKVKKLPDSEKPAVIVIKDFDEFVIRLKKVLVSMGVEPEEILINHITYLDYYHHGKNSWLDLCQEPPKQLFAKDIRFEDQNESRVIVNTISKDILQGLSKPIYLGPMFDIADVVYSYHYHGIEIEMDAIIEKDEY